VNLDHLRDVFCKVYTLGNQEDEEESEPSILLVNFSGFDDKDWQPGKENK
jgi:hypothetical protein